MSGAAIEIIPSGLEALNGRIDRLLKGLKNPTPMLWALAKEGEEQTHRRIVEDKHGPNGEIWPEWSPAYRATRHENQDKLDATGDLIKSLTAFADAQTAGWGTNVTYAAIHQFGGKAGRKHTAEIPARPYFGVSNENLKELLDIAESWLDRLLWGQA